MGWLSFLWAQKAREEVLSLEERVIILEHRLKTLDNEVRTLKMRK